MRRWTWLVVAVGVVLAGCSAATLGAVSGDDDDTGFEPDGDRDPDGTPRWTLDLDTSATNPFVQDFPATTTIRGVVTSSAGLSRVEVGGAVVQTDREGVFQADVPIAPGLQLVPVQAFDEDGHTRNGHRAILSARYLPEGEINPGAAAITVTNEVLAALTGGALGEVANLDLSDEIMAQGNMSQSGCDIQLQSVSHDPPNIALTVEAGQLQVSFTIPNLHVTFSGTCSMLITSTSFTGSLDTNVVVHTSLTAPPADHCLETFEHTYPTVDLPGFDLSLQSNDGGLIGMLMPLVGEMMQGKFEETMSEQIADQADTLVADQVAQFGQMGLGEGTTMTFNEVDMNVGFCLTGLESIGGALRARLGLSVTGPGGFDAPGAPMVDGELGAMAPSTLWLDADLISQMMFSLWRAGGLSGESSGDVTVGLIGLIAPEIGDLYPSDTPLTIAIDGRLPPLVTAAAPESGGDLQVDIGDLMIDLSADGDLLFRMSALVHLTVDLQSQDGAIMPVIIATSAEVTVLDEPIADVDDSLLQAAVEMQIGGQAQALLGDTGLGLPAFGGLTLNLQDAVPEPGGRYVRVTLAP